MRFTVYAPKVLKNSLFRKIPAHSKIAAIARIGKNFSEMYTIIEPKSAKFMKNTLYLGLPQKSTSRVNISPQLVASFIKFMT